MRLVGVLPPKKGHRSHPTNLPHSVGPHSVADIDRMRREIESSDEPDASDLRLDEFRSTTPTRRGRQGALASDESHPSSTRSADGSLPPPQTQSVSGDALLDG
jgi:hypothetical protein